MARIFCTAVLGLLVLAHASYALTVGDATAYSGTGQKDMTGKNSCQFDSLPSYFEAYYGALPSFVFNKAQHCGKCIRARGIEAGAPGKWVKVMIVDECASCKGAGDVDLSTDALKAVTGFSWDRKKMEWEFLSSCNDNVETASVDESQLTRAERKAARQAAKDALAAEATDSTEQLSPAPEDSSSDSTSDAAVAVEDAAAAPAPLADVAAADVTAEVPAPAPTTDADSGSGMVDIFKCRLKCYEDNGCPSSGNGSCRRSCRKQCRDGKYRRMTRLF